MALLFIFFMGLFIILALLSTGFWIWMLVDCIANKRLSDTAKAIWILVIIFTHFIGALCYLIAGRNTQSGANQYQQAPYAPYQQPMAGGAYGGYPPYQAAGNPPPYPPGTPQAMPNTSYHNFPAVSGYPPAPAANPYSYNNGAPEPQGPYQQGYQTQQVPPGTPFSSEPASWRQDESPYATYPEQPPQDLPGQPYRG